MTSPTVGNGDAHAAHDARLHAARASLLTTCLDLLAMVHADADAQGRPATDLADQAVMRLATIDPAPYGIRPWHVNRGVRSGVYIVTLTVGQVADLAEALAEQLGVDVEVPR